MNTNISTFQYPKLTLYYLAESRSHRILWLLNEISVPCTLIYSTRGLHGVCTNPAFAKAHPLGTAPILEIYYPYIEDPIILSESALIIDFLCENIPHGGKLLPAKYRLGQERAGMETDEWKRNKFYFAWGEESLLSFIAVAFTRDSLKTEPPQPVRLLTRFIAGQLDSGFLVPTFKKRFDFLEAELKRQGTKYITGDDLATADIMMVFVLELCVAKAGLTEKSWPLIMLYLRRLQSREAYRRAGERIEKEFGGYKSVEEI